MKIIILGDTHMPKMAKNLPKKLRNELVNTDLILHTGDWQTIETVELLKSFAPVEGVFGNVDGEEIKRLFPEKQILEFDGYKIGLTHGHGRGKTTEKRSIYTFENEPIDLLIYGHSHIPVHKRIDDMILFNPGSPTDKRRQPHYSFGILTIEENISLEHIWFDDKSWW